LSCRRREKKQQDGIDQRKEAEEEEKTTNMHGMGWMDSQAPRDQGRRRKKNGVIRACVRATESPLLALKWMESLAARSSGSGRKKKKD
jgi:hypothetical protein